MPRYITETSAECVSPVSLSKSLIPREPRLEVSPPVAMPAASEPRTVTPTESDFGYGGPGHNAGLSGVAVLNLTVLSVIMSICQTHVNFDALSCAFASPD